MRQTLKIALETNLEPKKPDCGKKIRHLKKKAAPRLALSFFHSHVTTFVSIMTLSQDW